MGFRTGSPGFEPLRVRTPYTFGGLNDLSFSKCTLNCISEDSCFIATCRVASRGWWGCQDLIQTGFKSYPKGFLRASGWIPTRIPATRALRG